MADFLEKLKQYWIGWIFAGGVCVIFIVSIVLDWFYEGALTAETMADVYITMSDENGLNSNILNAVLGPYELDGNLYVMEVRYEPVSNEELPNEFVVSYDPDKPARQGVKASLNDLVEHVYSYSTRRIILRMEDMKDDS